MTKQVIPFTNELVALTFQSYPEPYKKKLLSLRALIFQVATDLKDKIGPLEETLKWGEPSYLTSQSKSGSTIRLAWHASRPTQYGVFFNCKTTLIAMIKALYGNIFNYSGNRAIIFMAEDPIPMLELSDCIALALTYHLNKRFFH